MTNNGKINGAATPLSDAAKAFPEVTISLGGKNRRLVYNLYSFMRLDEETGKNVFDGSAFNAARPKDLVALLWAGLVNDDPNLTLEQVAKEARLDEIMSLPAMIQQGFANSMPTPKQKKSSPTRLEEPTPKAGG